MPPRRGFKFSLAFDPETSFKQGVVVQTSSIERNHTQKPIAVGTHIGVTYQNICTHTINLLNLLATTPCPTYET